MSDQCFYVYGLYESEEANFPFYVGKGCGTRKNAHFCNSTRGNNLHKDRKIKKAKRNGKQPEARIIKGNLSEEKAYNIEYLLINVHYDDLTNICKNRSQGFGSKEMMGEKNPMYGKKYNHSEQTKEKISKANSGEKNGMHGVTGEDHHMTGRTFPESHSKKLSKASGKLSNKEASEVKWLAQNSDIEYSKIGKKYDISEQAISSIKTNTNRSHLNPEKPEYDILIFEFL